MGSTDGRGQRTVAKIESRHDAGDRLDVDSCLAPVARADLAFGPPTWSLCANLPIPLRGQEGHRIRNLAGECLEH